MNYKTGTDKQQLSFMPMCPDDYISEDHICRVISAFTNTLDMLELGFKYAEVKRAGNRPYDPRMMLNLYIYGYINRVRSSRRLEAETHRNVEVMWLMDGLRPDDKTICNFRKDNTKALRSTFRAFCKMCQAFGLYGGEVVATDGTKFRANNSRKNIHNKTTVEKELSRIDKKISEYMNALDEADTAESGATAPNAEQLREVLQKLNERKEEYEGFKERLGNGGEVSTVDPDARLMRQGGDGRTIDACYNVQTVTDSKHKLIIDFDVTSNPNDKGHLYDMSERALDMMEVDELTNLGDKGYYDGEDIVKCEDNGVTCLIAKPKPGGPKKEEGFTLDKFTYDRENDCYFCPCQNRLRFMRMEHNNSTGKEYRVYANYSACANCPKRSACTKRESRQIRRLPYQDKLDIVDERTKKNKELYRKRQEIVEHPFGTIKAVWGYKQFLCRTIPKVRAEISLAYLAYNMRRVVNILHEFRGNTVQLIGG